MAWENGTLAAFLETLRLLEERESHVPEAFTVEIKTEEDRKFWFNMMAHGYVGYVGPADNKREVESSD